MPHSKGALATVTVDENGIAFGKARTIINLRYDCEPKVINVHVAEIEVKPLSWLYFKTARRCVTFAQVGRKRFADKDAVKGTAILEGTKFLDYNWNLRLACRLSEARN